MAVHVSGPGGALVISIVVCGKQCLDNWLAVAMQSGIPVRCRTRTGAPPLWSGGHYLFALLWVGDSSGAPEQTMPQVTTGTGVLTQSGIKQARHR